MTALHIPDIDPDADVLTAALAYAKAGWYILPAERGSKHPGSVVGKQWPTLSSRDPQQLAAWFAGTTHGIALHCGRSGAVLVDVDDPDKVPQLMRPHLVAAPHQSSRPEQPRRGHYPFLMPAGRMLGNSTGRLGGGWGEIRGRNGVIIAAPTPHPEGGEYRWVITGAVRVLPAEIAEKLPDGADAEDTVSDEAVEAFIAEHQDATRPDVLNGLKATLVGKIEAGESRHDSTYPVLAGAMKEARAGFYPAQLAVDTLRPIFVNAAQLSPKARTEKKAKAEFNSMLAWAVAQALAADLDEVRKRVEERMPTGATSFDSPTVDYTAAAAPPTVDKYMHLPVAQQRYERSLDNLEAAYLPYDEKIWAARPALAHIRERALAVTALPIATLACVLTRALMLVPPNIVVESGVGAPTSLNLFMLACGRPGAGKDIAEYVAGELLPLPAPDSLGQGGIETLAPASGEAIASAFYYDELAGDDGKGGKSVKPRLVRRQAALVRVHEVESLTKSAGRDGSIIFPVLRQGFSGQQLGQSRADRRKTMIVQPGTYRLGVIVGVQPALAGPLFEEQGGLAERWLFVPAGGRCTTSANAELYENLPQYTVSVPDAAAINAGVQHNGHAIVPAAVRRDIRDQRDRNVAGVADAADAHGNQTRLRVAYAFALLDGRVQLDVEDWELAGYLMAVSDLTRRWCRALWEDSARVVAEERATVQGFADARRSVVRRGEASKSTSKTASRILQLLREAPEFKLKNRELTQKLRSDEREFMRDAVAALEADGAIKRDPAGAARGGHWVLVEDMRGVDSDAV